MLEDRDQDIKCQDQDRRISVSSGLETKTAVSRTARPGQTRVGPGRLTMYWMGLVEALVGAV